MRTYRMDYLRHGDNHFGAITLCQPLGHPADHAQAATFIIT